MTNQITPDRQARLILDTIADLLSQVPAPDDLIGIRSPRPATGGTPLPGSLPHGLDAITDDWETGQVRTADGCREILAEIADEWAEKLGYEGIGSRPDGPRHACDWLADHTEHAYRALDSDTWDASVGEIRRVHSIALHLAGQDPAPSGRSCPNDGTRLVRYPFDDGFTDWELCHTCGTAYTEQSWQDAYGHALQAARDTNTLIPITALPRLGIPKATVYSWIQRGHLTPIRIDGVRYVHTAHIPIKPGRLPADTQEETPR
ncbi:helix-turn-helix domain-containing protein [Actinobaculum sp. 352]|uniref:helix-turn-helix domain-containing protein n=1 Tax=Actinobaculum sp. 352 TaxID=2490946 RepID=UPI000F7E1D2C|nr:helix-turn-helix domain-containing protein [Actinobaculum sp. 352]RTE47907.1 DNA-binding protein [Actinobaculum sp. 352]